MFVHKLKKISNVDGYAWKAKLPVGFEEGDSIDNPYKSSALLLENGRLMGPADALHEDIKNFGLGLYSHWGNDIYFSTTDNSDPRKNGREYNLFSPESLFDSKEIGQVIGIVSKLHKNEDEMQKFALVEELLSHLLPEYKLADWGRIYMDDKTLTSIYANFENTWRSYDRKFNVFQLIKLVNNVPGDLAECGVYKGATACFMAKAILDYEMNCKLHLFDSFLGLSDPLDKDGDFWVKGDMFASLEEVKKNLRDFSLINFFPGWIPSCFDSVKQKQYRFIHLDVDLHDPTMDSLRFFYPRLTSGGIILCDDYGFKTCAGARAAMDDFFADKPNRLCI